MRTRSAAAKVLASLLDGKGSLSALLPDALSQVPERDRSLLQELCYGTCRWQPRLQCFLDLLLDKPLRGKDRDVHALLLVGLYQLEHLRVPDHAAISSTVEATQALKKPWAKGLVNGVLRRYQREADTLRNQLVDRPEFKYAHPSWLIDDIRKAWPAQADTVFEANNLHPPFTLRVNRAHLDREQYGERLRDAGLEATPTPWSAVGITLIRAVDVEKLPGFAQGDVSVQDEAAQLSAPLLELAAGMDVLDACCAPGGKTAHILESEPRLHRVLGLDVSAERLSRTRATLERLGLEAELLAGDASKPESWAKDQRFDRILVDAPCSATGVIRRHPDIKLLRTRAEVQRLVQTQSDILNALWPLLKADGLLLYATCSILPAENSQVIAGFLDARTDAVHEPIEAQWGISQAFGRQLLPFPGGHDGFYFARLRKQSRKAGPETRPQKPEAGSIVPSIEKSPQAGTIRPRPPAVIPLT